MTTRHRTSRLTTAVIVVLVLAVGLLTWRLSTTAADAVSTAITASPPPAVTGPQEELTWQNVAGFELPVSSTAGPLCRNATRAACFQNSDAGAALAAAHLLVRTFAFTGPAIFGPTIDSQVVGEGKEPMRRITQDLYEKYLPASGARSPAPLNIDAGSLAGYRFADYQRPGTRTVAVLTHVTDGEMSGFTEFRIELVWRDGDWRVVAPDWGDWSNAAVAITTADPSVYRSYDDLGTVTY